MKNLLLIPVLLLCAACAGPASDEPHPFDKYMTHDTPPLPGSDDLRNCGSYGCIRR